jgi:transposase
VLGGDGGGRRRPRRGSWRNPFTSGVSVSEVARRHGLRPQQLFGWRREARSGRLAVAGEAPGFVPIVASHTDETSRPACEAGGSIEIELRGIVVRVHGRVEAATLAEVLVAVKSIA